ncbi:zona pellucida sperm-binding protein 4-like [Rana temporaria]|uniref:zona pellucida sperm-binding protein 4-like n=1 Tax=Rana temporaria TaxID=8407 RepID=UPI001AADE116|nr:zona pellucida sperm-binding protein 4-like [Rana temporaria]
MGLSIEGFLGGLWSCYLLGLVHSAGMTLDQLSGVHCGAKDMSFSLPVGVEVFAADIAVLDNKDNARSLQNDTACGLWIGRDVEKTLLVTAAYDGCYVREEDEDYVMTVILDRIDNGELDHQKKDLKCPLKSVMDAPSASDCAAIQKSDRLPCAENAVSRDVCEGLGCCFSPSDSSPCYFGKEVTAQCTADGQVLVAISKDVTIPSLILDSAHVVDVDSSSCPELSVLKNSAFVAFRFPLSCGVRKLSGSEMVVYENTFEATIETMIWQGASITRDSTMRLLVRCNYSQSAPAPLMVEVVTLPPPPPVSTTGPMFLEMRIAQDAQYRSYYQEKDYPLIKGLRDLVFLEVRILRRTDPNLVLVLNNCWATPSSDPTQEMQWPLLVGSCPYTDEENDYLTVLSPVETAVDFPKYYQRFIVSAFVFVDEPTQTAFSETVYFHCSASVCIPSTQDPCSPSCSQRRKRASKEPLEQIVVSKGPINVVAIENRPNVKMSVSIEGSTKNDDSWNFEMLNETDEGFIGVDGPIDGNVIEAEKLVPRRAKGATDEKPSFLMWVRGAAVGGGILMVLVTLLGIWRCHRRQRPTMHTVKI